MTTAALMDCCNWSLSMSLTFKGPDDFLTFCLSKCQKLTLHQWLSTKCNVEMLIHTFEVIQ